MKPLEQRGSDQEPSSFVNAAQEQQSLLLCPNHSSLRVEDFQSMTEWPFPRQIDRQRQLRLLATQVSLLPQGVCARNIVRLCYLDDGLEEHLATNLQTLFRQQGH